MKLLGHKTLKKMMFSAHALSTDNRATFSVSQETAKDAVEKIGAEIVRKYETIRAGSIAVIAIDCSEIGVESAAGGYGEYTYSAVREYVTPNGVRFAAGGGGPSDNDTIKFL